MNPQDKHPRAGAAAGNRAPDPEHRPAEAAQSAPGAAASREIGGREGPEPTRYGDWELRGRCIDF
ncbi:MAG: DUF1674 domain-containing protein [Gammaproteobacteria bacterium]|nr:DUF1674 domain-containing protein [Gammaproteobacteria bacterium]